MRKKKSTVAGRILWSVQVQWADTHREYLWIVGGKTLASAEKAALKVLRTNPEFQRMSRFGIERIRNRGTIDAVVGR